MALTDEEKVLQAGILAEKTDEATNPNMTYSSMVTNNKGLNPAYFVGNNTKIVNAINSTYKQAQMAMATVTNFGGKINGALLDTGTPEGLAKLEQLRTDMGHQTLIEGLIDLYENKLPTYAAADSIEFATAEELVAMYNAIGAEPVDDNQEPKVQE